MDRFMKILGALICAVTLAVSALAIVQTPPVPGPLAVFITLLPAAALAIVCGLGIAAVGAMLAEIRTIRRETEQQTLALRDLAQALRNGTRS